MGELFICADCGCHSEDPHVITLEEVMADLSDSDEIAEALETVGLCICDHCRSTNLTSFESLGL